MAILGKRNFASKKVAKQIEIITDARRKEFAARTGEALPKVKSVASLKSPSLKEAMDEFLEKAKQRGYKVKDDTGEIVNPDQAIKDEFNKQFTTTVPKSKYNTVITEALRDKMRKKTFVEGRPVLKSLLLGKHPLGTLADKGTAAIKKIYAGRVASDGGYFIRRKK